MWDLLYVSQNSMSQFKTTVTEGFTRIWDEVRPCALLCKCTMSTCSSSHSACTPQHPSMSSQLLVRRAVRA